MQAKAILVATLVLLLAPAAQAKEGPLDQAHARGLAYLAGQGGDGAYPSGLAPYAVEAAHAAGLDLAAWPDPARPAIDAVAMPGTDASFLHLVRPAYAAALSGRLHDWQGDDLEARLRTGFDGTQFGDPALLNDDVYALLALVAGGVAADDAEVASSMAFIASHQNADGGWSYAAGGGSGTDTTAMVLLLAERLGPPALAEASLLQARSFILGNLVPGLGFSEMRGGEPNCDSTAWALRVGVGGEAMEAWRYLLGLQAEGGGFAYQEGLGANPLCTAEAVTLLGDALHGRVAAPLLDAEGPRGIPVASSAGLALALLATAWFRRT